MFEHVKKLGMDSLAITDHGALYGAIEFYKKGKEAGVKPIIGVEAYTTNIPLGEKAERGKFKNHHILLLAKNEEGYKNLMEISSIAHLEGYYYRPRVDRKTLKKYSKGIICTSSCPIGEVGQALIEDDYKKAKGVVQWYHSVFGKDYYLEIQRHKQDSFITKGMDDVIRVDLQNLADNEKKWVDGVIKLSREMGIPLVATNDTHYVAKEDATAQDALVCISTGKNVSDVKRLRYVDVPDFYIKTADEMYEIFSDVPDACKNTNKIAEKCNLEISTLGKWYFPSFDLPKKTTAEKELKNLIKTRTKLRYPKPTKEIKKRIKYELDIIIGKGYASYFLIMMDMVNWSNEQGIITNTRGSAAGSIVSYILGVTTVDPIKYYLPFERFLNPFRPSPPDIDLDISDDRREEVLNYIGEKYGHDRVAQICTFGRMLSRAAVRDMARVLGYEYATGDKVAKLIPPPRQGFPVTIPSALDEVSELKNLYDTDKDAKNILDLAMQVEGNARHVSVHAAAAVISPSKLTDFVPLRKEPSGDKVITQYEMHACEDVGLIKFDILGIRNLAILGSSIQIVKETRNKVIKISEVPLDDKKTYEMLGRGETMGVFQLSSAGITKYIKDLQPERIEDLMAMVALYRPGPMSVIPDYIQRKKNPKLVEYLDPRMEKYLASSYGLIVYQDDLLYTAIDLAGYDWKEADKFRKAVGKKIPKEMAAQKEKFFAGIVKNGQRREFAQKLWDLFEPFQAYGFNKAHAASYGMVSYQTAYMKANFPAEYMAALLTAECNNAEKVSAAVNECKRMGIEVLPPDINESGVGFTIVDSKGSLDDKGIRFGLSAIKNVGKAAIESILIEKNKQKFASFADFLSRVDARKVNKRVLESLIKVGAMGEFGNRASLLASMDEIRGRVVKPKSNKNQQGLFGQEELKKSMMTHTSEAMVELDELAEDELVSLERQLLGFSLTAKPIGQIISSISHKATHRVNEIDVELLLDEKVKIAGIVSEVRVIITKKSGQEMAFVKLEDETGIIDIVVFPSIYKNTRAYWIESKPLVIGGKVNNRGEELSIIAESLDDGESSFENQRNGAKKILSQDVLYIRVPKDISMPQLKQLRTLLLEHPGTQSVNLMFEGKGKRQIKLPFKINWSSNLASFISELLEA